MPSSYTPSLRLTLPVTGELSGTWGNTVNSGITNLLDAAVAGTAAVTMTDADYTLTTANGATDEARKMFVTLTGTLTAARNVICPSASKLYFIKNTTTGGFAVTLKTSAGTGISVPNGKSMVLYCNGTDVIDATNHYSSITIATALAATSGGTGQASYTTGDLLYASSSTALSKLGVGTAGQVLTSSGTAPQWTTISGVAVTTFSAGTTGFTPSTATSGAVTLGGTLATTNGGTGLTSFTANGVVYASSTSALATGSALTYSGGALLNTGSFAPTDGTNIGEIKINAATLDFNTSSSAVPQVFRLGSAEQMRLTSTGLGIGTSSPGAKLDVRGNATFTGNTTARQTADFTNTGGQLYVGSESSTGGAVFTGSSAYAGIVGTNTNTVLQFATNGAVKATLDSSGNLGLGVTPSAWNSGLRAIQVGYSASIDSTTSVANTRWSNNAFVDSSGGFKYINTAVAQVYEQDNNGKHIFYTAPSGTAGNTITFTQAMTLDASGNLLVGRTSGSALFGTTMYVGAAGGTGTVSVPGGYIFSNTTNDLRYAAGSSASGAHIFSSAFSATEYARIDASGNLGIGTSSPGAKLETVASGTALYFSGGDSSVARRLQFNATTTTNTGDTQNINALGSTGVLAFSTNSTERMRLDASGNLGLGVTPSTRLDVFGTTSIQPYFRLKAATGSTGGFNRARIGLYNNAASDTGWDITEIGDGNDALTFDSVVSGTATERMRLDASGNLGLGVTPSAWSATFKVLEIANFSFFSGTGGLSSYIDNNAYFNVSNQYIYKNTGYAGEYAMLTSDGSHRWYTAPSGTAGNAISFTQAMTLDASGNLGVGTTLPGAKLDVNGLITTSTLRASGGIAAVSGVSSYLIGNTAAAGGFRLAAGLNVTFDGTNWRTGTDGGSNGGAAILSAYGSGNLEFHTVANNGTTGQTISNASMVAKMTLDASGNLGLGVTPSAWYSSFPTKAIQIGAVGAIATVNAGAGNKQTNLYNNLYTDVSGTQTYLTSDSGSLYQQMSGTHRWYYAPSGTAGTVATLTQVMTLDTSGVLSVGQRIQATGNTVPASGAGIELGSDGSTTTYITSYNRTGSAYLAAISDASSHVWQVSGTERARITSGGDLLVGTTAALSNGRLRVSQSGSASQGVVDFNHDAASGTRYLAVFYVQGVEKGSITSDGSTVAYNTSSDRRLKDNIAPAADAGAVIDAIEVVQHDWKVGGHTRFGVIAQDLNAVAPEAVSAGDDGEEIERTWGVDYSKLVPMLIKEIQSLRARVAQLESK